MKILLDTCECIFYVSDNVMTRVHLANNILVHIIMLLFKSHTVYRQLKKLVKTHALINMVRHFPVLHFQVVHFQSPPGISSGTLRSVIEYGLPLPLPLRSSYRCISEQITASQQSSACSGIFACKPVVFAAIFRPSYFFRQPSRPRRVIISRQTTAICARD